jgi:hypothetical protein
VPKESYGFVLWRRRLLLRCPQAGRALKRSPGHSIFLAGARAEQNARRIARGRRDAAAGSLGLDSFGSAVMAYQP